MKNKLIKLTFLVVAIASASCGSDSQPQTVTTPGAPGINYTRTFHQDVVYGIDFQGAILAADKTYDENLNCIQWVTYQPVDSSGNPNGTAEERLDFANIGCGLGGPAMKSIVGTLAIVQVSTGVWNLTAVGNPSKIEGHMYVNSSSKNEIQAVCGFGEAAYTSTSSPNCAMNVGSSHIISIVGK